MQPGHLMGDEGIIPNIPELCACTKRFGEEPYAQNLAEEVAPGARPGPSP